jgi:curved DNA-binding protein CbpA
MKNPYSILDINTDATPEEIMAAYRQRAKETHPDYGGDPDLFNEVNQAMVLLKDPKKRKRFDEEGIIDDSKPDNLYSSAIEKVAQFFVQSVEASLHNPLTLDDIDLIKGGVAHFQQQAMQSRQQINEHKTRIAKFEGVIKRLKTKRQDDIITRMMKSHAGQYRRIIEANEYQIKVLEKAIEVILDYTFEQLKPETSYSPFTRTGLFPNTRRPEW